MYPGRRRCPTWPHGVCRNEQGKASNNRTTVRDLRHIRHRLCCRLGRHAGCCGGSGQQQHQAHLRLGLPWMGDRVDHGHHRQGRLSAAQVAAAGGRSALRQGLAGTLTRLSASADHPQVPDRGLWHTLRLIRNVQSTLARSLTNCLPPKPPAMWLERGTFTTIRIRCALAVPDHRTPEPKRYFKIIASSADLETVRRLRVPITGHERAGDGPLKFAWAAVLGSSPVCGDAT